MSETKHYPENETVYVPQFLLSDVIEGAEAILHPAFVVNGRAVRGIYVAKYLASVDAESGRARACRGCDPAVRIDLDAASDAARKNGAGYHLMTAAEWGAVALLCRKNGFLPYGNNGDGKDVRETAYTATVSYRDDEKGIVRTATGSGPDTWNHNGRADGIADLNGNVWEWNAGMRLVYGELQFLTSPFADASADSDAWRALDGSTGDFIVPRGDGQTENAVKLDYRDGVWVYVRDGVESLHKGARFCDFASARAEGLCRRAEVLLRAYALLPEGDRAAYDGVSLYANNGASERIPFRGGRWGQGLNAGLFKTCIDDPRTYAGDAVGFRYAYIDPEEL